MPCNRPQPTHLQPRGHSNTSHVVPMYPWWQSHSPTTQSPWPLHNSGHSILLHQKRKREKRKRVSVHMPTNNCRRRWGVGGGVEGRVHNGLSWGVVPGFPVKACASCSHKLAENQKQFVSSYLQAPPIQPLSHVQVPDRCMFGNGDHSALSEERAVGWVVFPFRPANRGMSWSSKEPEG